MGTRRMSGEPRRPSRPRRAGFVTAAVVVQFVPALQRWLVFDRAAVISGGQFWRIATGSLVHFSASHLAYDLFAVAVAGTLLERDGWRLVATTTAAATVIGLAVVLLAPGVAQYGGLSGIACTLVMLAALNATARSGSERVVALFVLVLLAAKAVAEGRGNGFLFVAAGEAPFVPVPLAHLAGYGVGTAAFILTRLRRSGSPNPPISLSATSPERAADPGSRS